MQAYIIRRILLLIPTLIGLTFIIFISVRFLPGDVVDQIVGESGTASPQLRASIEKQYNLNENIPKQYVTWLGDLFQGDFGTSIMSGRSVSDIFKERMPETVELGILAILISTSISIPIGVISAVRHDTILDYVTRSFAIALIAIPSFWLGLLAITYGFLWFGWTPPLRYKELWQDPLSNLRTIWVPAVILGAGGAGTVMRFMRSTVLEVLSEDYVRTAWAKGLRERSVIFRHVMRNALIPVVTIIGLQIPVVIGGTVILEQIFSLPGLGSELLTSVQQRDYPIVQGLVLIFGLVVVVANLTVDLIYPLLDRRIRYS